MTYYFFKSPYRWFIAGLGLALIGLWYYWFKTEQIISSALNVYTTGIVLLNIGLGSFSFDRHQFVTRFLFFFSYLVIALAFYTLFSVSRGVR